MKDKVNQFVANLNGQFVEVSSVSALNQCMDLAYAFVFCLDFPKATIQNQYAYQVFTNPKAITREYFEIIPNSPTFIPQDGDIGVFDKTSGNVAGHIGICLSGGTTNTFPFFEQNSPIGTSAHITPNKKYGNEFLGVLRPKVKEGQLIVTDQTRIPQIENKEVQTIKSEYYDRANKIESQYTEITRLNKDLKESIAYTIELKQEIDILKAQKPKPPVVVEVPETGTGSTSEQDNISYVGELPSWLALLVRIFTRNDGNSK